MTTAEQRLEQRVPTADATIQPRTASHTGARYRLTLALAGLAALVAWGLFDRLGDQHSGADQAGGTAAITDRQQHYDGYGKWGGYMP